jgi:hypothetical protein
MSGCVDPHIIVISFVFSDIRDLEYADQEENNMPPRTQLSLPNKHSAFIS